MTELPGLSRTVASTLVDLELDDRFKGVPGGASPLGLSEVGRQGWNILRQDLPLPVMVLRNSALENNLRVMQAITRRWGVSIAPHGKTSMSPQLFERQLSAGAWGITVATVHQLQVCRRFGFARVLLANQLVGRQNIRYVVEQLNASPDFDFYCLVDSIDLVRELTAAARSFGLRRPIKVLLEAGFVGGRTGCRTEEQAIELLKELRRQQGFLCLVGVEGFEGIIDGQPNEVVTRIDAYLEYIARIVSRLEPADLKGTNELLLTAGGSSYFDRVIESLVKIRSFLPTRVVIRSGCYVTHDSGSYARSQLLRDERGWHEHFTPALEIWSYVQSVPEPGLAILTMGKRDCPYDLGYPLPTRAFRPATGDSQPLPGWRIQSLNDQHAYMRLESGSSGLRVGDMVMCGISHPCTAFDKWRFLPVVNDQYDVIDGLVTMF